MVTSSTDPPPHAPVVTTAAKPSLRQRLFSSGSRKAGGARQGKEAAPPENILVPEVNHPVENSASTSSTLTGEPPSNVEEGQAPEPQQATSLAQPLAVAESAVPATILRAQHAEAERDREQASVNATLTTNNRHIPFYRRRTGNKSSDGALPSSASDPSIIKPRRSRTRASSQRSRPSFLSRVVHKVVPCVSPDPDMLQNDASYDEDYVSERRRSLALKDASHTSLNTHEMQQISHENPTITTPATNEDALDIESLPLSIPNVNVNPPPSPTDSDIIVTPPHLLPEDETDGVTSGAVQPPGSTGTPPAEVTRTHTHDSSSGDESDGTTYTDDEGEDRQMAEEQDEEERLIKNGGSGIPIGPDGLPKPLLPPILPKHAGRKCLVLDLDETLVHSSFKAVQQADFIVPVEIEYHWHHFHVLKRPGVDNFLKRMGEIYEIVVFTASLSKYADPVLDKLDIHEVVAHRLFRESCFSHKGNYVKDLSQLGRPIADTIILDNSPASYIFHPNNAVPVSSWFNDPHDAELTDLIPFLADLTNVPDVTHILDGAR
ncbi:Uncharacterized protein C2F7.02c [Hypsizygus marmoreus]|uniref:Uncharacterized protein C2F7.02c n=1 Tax=Hypsizygus marmoreus TaxID=39966 RepID=A0A369J3P0_HYPMA|nr:Uncharacterized protein C2F7.02c [Hypsizygus marmoreus]